jgi:hypothetical protein
VISTAGIRRPVIAVLSGLVLALALPALTGCAPIEQSAEIAPATPSVGSTAVAAPTPTATPGQPVAATGSALHALDQLRVAGRGPKTGYARAEFGPAWSDIDRNGCDTRNDILRRDLTATTFKPATGDCVLLSGTLADPYTGGSILFVRGGPSEVDIDHVVALGHAWVTGAAGWTDDRRKQLANDPYNLLAVDSSANRQKGDGDAATWLPSEKPFRCDYVARQIGVKTKHGLYVTPPEKTAMRSVLARCPDQPLPPEGLRTHERRD